MFVASRTIASNALDCLQLVLGRGAAGYPLTLSGCRSVELLTGRCLFQGSAELVVQDAAARLMSLGVVVLPPARACCQPYSMWVGGFGVSVVPW